MKKKPPPPEGLLGGTGFWRPAAAARGGGWATAAALLLLLLVSHLGVLLVRLRFRRVGRIARPEAAAAAPAPASASPGSAPGLEGLVTEGDLRQLVGNLGVGGREPETEGWEHVISKGNDDISYRVWCDKPTVCKLLVTAQNFFSSVMKGHAPEGIEFQAEAKQPHGSLQAWARRTRNEIGVDLADCHEVQAARGNDQNHQKLYFAVDNWERYLPNQLNTTLCLVAQE